jgi:hypothetical protein
MHTFCGHAKAADLAPIIKELQAAGKTSLWAVAAGLNDASVPTARGGSSPQLMRMLERLDLFREEEAAASESNVQHKELADPLARPLVSHFPVARDVAPASQNASVNPPKPSNGKSGEALLFLLRQRAGKGIGPPSHILRNSMT